MDLLLIVQIIVFIFGTIFIVLVSKRSLKSLEHHGFYRFFVFEFTLVLILLNIPHWFDHPFTFQQIVAWLLLFISIMLLAQSLYFFKKVGSEKRIDDNAANFEFENTASLIKEGIYKYIRHPMYGSLLFLAIGAMLKDITLISVSLTVAVIIFLVLTAKIEEKENIKFFGSEYEDYIKKTKMFIPYIF
jgi:protein-S-isoprenylcysteine O-methyltransferase Ste14